MSLNLASYLASGYGAEQILEFVEKMFPNIARAAKSAKQTGKSAEEIIRLLSSMNPKQLKEADKRASKLNYDSPLERANEAARDDSGNPVMQGAKVLGGALLGAGAARGIPAIAGMLKPKQGLIPPTPYQSTIQPSTQSAEGLPNLQPGQAIPIQNAQQLAHHNRPLSTPQAPGQAQQLRSQPTQEETLPSPLSSQNVLSSPAAQQPAPIEQYRAESKKKAESIITELGIDKTLKNVSLEGKNLEQISKEVIASLSPDQKKAYQEKRNKGEAKPMVAMLKDYFGQAEGETGLEQPEVAQGIAEPSLAKEAEIEPEKMQKGSIVATPQGIGEVKSIRNGQALVEHDGKLHKVSEDDLIQSPLPEKDLADLYDDLIKGIEKETEEDVSRMTGFAGYDPKTNTLAFLPHSGALYTYDDISPEDVKLLTSILSTRKTSGENFIGAWKAGSKSPIGAAMSALIKKLQSERGGKGKEYSGKFETLYSALEPAIQAAKKKKKKRSS